MIAGVDNMEECFFLGGMYRYAVLCYYESKTYMIMKYI